MEVYGIRGYSQGSSGMRRQTTVTLSTTAIFIVFDGCIFGNFSDKAIVITQDNVGFSVIPKCINLNDPDI